MHLLHAEPRGDEAVAARSPRPAGARSRRERSDEAVASLARAIAEPPPAAARSALLLDLGAR